MNTQTRAQKALDYFNQGYSCAQSVFAAFHEEMAMPEAQALTLASSFGGGVGGLREVCGAFLGLSMALGALQGYASPTDTDAKKAHYTRIQDMAARFTAQFETLICRDLLASHDIIPSPVPAERNAAYYKERPCARYVEACAMLGQEALQNG